MTSEPMNQTDSLDRTKITILASKHDTVPARQPQDHTQEIRE